MKPHTLSTRLIFYGIALIITSCSKEINDVIYQPREASASLTESARIWYLQHREAKPTPIEHDMLTKYWARAATLQTSDSNTILVVPLPDPPATAKNKDITFKRFLVFQPSGSTITSGRVVELLGSKYNVESNADFLLKRIAQNSIPGFNGSILQYDINYKPLGSTHFTEGKKKTNTQVTILKFSPRDTKSPIRAGAGNLPVSLLQPGRYAIGGRIYAIKGMAPYKTLLIEDNDSLVSAFIRHPRMHGRPGEIKPSGSETITGSFRAVLGSGRMQQLSAIGTRNLIVTLYCMQGKNQGKVAAVEFTIFRPEKVRLTLNEIDRLAEYMKLHLFFELPPAADEKTNLVWPVAQSVRFDMTAKAGVKQDN